MICFRCKKKLKKAYFHNGKVYGPECVVKVGGFIRKSHRVKIDDAKEYDKQMRLL